MTQDFLEPRPNAMLLFTKLTYWKTDNTGSYANLIHPSTIQDVSDHFPRLKWSGCFASTIHEENRLKPWAHTTTLGEEEFSNKVLGNTLMAPYE